MNEQIFIHISIKNILEFNPFLELVELTYQYVIK